MDDVAKSGEIGAIGAAVGLGSGIDSTRGCICGKTGGAKYLGPNGVDALGAGVGAA